jgi:acyl carrier protein
MKESIREVLKKHARLGVDIDTLGTDSDLYLAGMTSHATVNVMLALENAFGIEFPDHMLRRGVFESIDSIHAAIESLREDPARMAG